MTPTELSVRVTAITAAVVAVLAGAAAWLAGPAAGFGLLAAGALGLADFLCLARAVAGGRAPGRGAWVLATGGRFAGLAAALAVLLGSGWAHPVAVAGGLVVLPLAVVAAGLGGRSRPPHLSS